MILQIGLNIVTLVMCVLTLTMATAALMPHLKQAIVMLRDGLLWLTLLAVVGGVAVVGWGRFFSVYASLHDKDGGVVESSSVRLPPAMVNPAASEPQQATLGNGKTETSGASLMIPPPSARSGLKPAFSANRSRGLPAKGDQGRGDE